MGPFLQQLRPERAVIEPLPIVDPIAVNLEEVSHTAVKSSPDNSRHPATRQRFTIAHELGHLLLHGDELHIDEGFPFAFRDEVSSLAVDPGEIEANHFAAELLMPASWLIREIRGQSLDIESEKVIVSLAKTYGVSVQSMTHRLTNLAARR
jgi:Zn-dependent peptidase ImmA (M78 family)